jgi:hypothetical protein
VRQRADAVQMAGQGGATKPEWNEEIVDGGAEPDVRAVVGGVDTHKDLHVATIVDHHDRVLGTRSFASTRQGYRQMLAWMRSLGDRI